MAPQHQQYSSHQPAILRAQISQPKNFERRLHIDKDFNWSGQVDTINFVRYRTFNYTPAGSLRDILHGGFARKGGLWLCL